LEYIDEGNGIDPPGAAELFQIPERNPHAGEILLNVELVGLCGSDLNSYLRVVGHEIATTVLQGNSQFRPGTRVTVSPYTSCASYRRGRPNACQFNQNALSEDFRELPDLLATGSFSTNRVITSVVSLEETTRALAPVGRQSRKYHEGHGRYLDDGN
jgi:threonine dehydrogenase-like Zn-dependent dehydrogenase